MTSWFRLILLCLALLCLLLHLTQPADLNHQLQIVSWGSGFDRGREPAADDTVSVVTSMRFDPARTGSLASRVLDCTLTAGNNGPPGWETHGHRHRLGLGELPVKRSSRQLQPMTLEHASARKYWLKPPILKLRRFATAFS